MKTYDNKKPNLEFVTLNFIITISLGLFATFIYVYTYEYWYYNIYKDHAMGFEYLGAGAAFAAPAVFTVIFLTPSLISLILIHFLKKKWRYKAKIHFLLYFFISLIFGSLVFYPKYRFNELLSLFTPIAIFFLFQISKRIILIILKKTLDKF